MKQPKEVISKVGQMIPEYWKRWVNNCIQYTLPLFSATLFAQLAMGVDTKKALSVSMITLYGAIRDFINKKGETTVYEK